MKFPLAVKMVMIDLDGTLIDTAPDLAAAANRTLEELGRPTHNPKLVSTWIGNGVPRLVKRALTGTMDGEPDDGLFRRGLTAFEKTYGEHVSDLSRPFPGVVEGLEHLSNRGYSLACITNKAERFTLPLLRDLKLDGFFQLVLCGDSLPRQKPDPLPLRHACKYFGITSEHGVLIGDSINDVQAARAAGMPVICVPYGYNHGHDIRDAHPDAVIAMLADLPELLRPYH